MSAASIASGAGVLRALAYVTVRTMLGKLRRSLAYPVQLVLIVIAMLGLLAIQVVAITTGGDVVGGVRATAAATAVLCVALAAMSVSAVRDCPIRLRGADVAWLLPCPTGPRMLVAWLLAETTMRAVMFGAAAATGAAVRSEALSAVMLQPAAALAGALLLVRSVSYATHLATVHGVPRVVAGITAPLLWALAALPAALTAAGVSLALPGWVLGAGAPLRALVGALVSPIVSPADARWSEVGVAAAVAVALAGVTVALGTGYQDRAARRTWETEALIAAFKDGSATVTAMAEVVAARLPAGVPSFDGMSGLRGEAALMWRAIAHQRRSWRSDLRFPLMLFAAATGAAILARQYALAPAAPLLLAAAAGFSSGFVEELDHLPVRTLPGSPWRKVLAVDAVPVIMLTVWTLLVIAPAVTVRADPWSVRLTDLLAVPGLVAAVIAASSAAALWVPTVGRRMLTTLLLVSLVAAATMRAWTFVDGLARGPAMLLLGAALAAIFWAIAAWLLATRRYAR